MPLGKTIECSMRNSEGPGGANSWAFFLFCVVRHLQAGYRLLVAIQPLHPLPVASIGAVTLAL